jgi:hypothetical protein
LCKNCQLNKDQKDKSNWFFHFIELHLGCKIREIKYEFSETISKTTTVVYNCGLPLNSRINKNKPP